jgi:hypothetical protein
MGDGIENARTRSHDIGARIVTWLVQSRSSYKLYSLHLPTCYKMMRSVVRRGDQRYSLPTDAV